ncbi:IS3 family transposase [Streptomyces asiaticus]
MTANRLCTYIPPSETAPARSKSRYTPATRRKDQAGQRNPAGVLAFIDEHRDRFGGVEPICRTLTGHDCKITSSTYYAHKKRLEIPSARSLRDEELKERIQEVCTSDYRVYGARKIWRELNRQEHAVARRTVERLMRETGIAGAIRGRKVIATLTDPAAERAPDLLDRDFVAGAPNRCWAADFTHVATWSGVVYVAFVVDTFSRRIVGWSAATSKETRLVLDALKMALWQRDQDGFPHAQGELIHQSDVGSQPGLNRSRRPSIWTERGSRRRSAQWATPTTTH